MTAGVVDLSTLFEADGRRSSAAGNEPFALIESHVWIVATGRIDVFLTEFRGGAPYGRRHHVFSVSTGNVMFGGRMSLDAGAWALLAVGTAGTEIVCLSASAFWARVNDASALEGAIETWIDQVFSSMAHSVMPERMTYLAPGGDLAMDRGGRARPSQGIVWLSHSQGHSSLFGQPHLRLNGDGFVPLSARGWVEIDSGSRLHLRDTRAIVAAGDAQKGLDHLYQLAIQAFEARVQETANAQWDQLTRKSAARTTAHSGAWTRLAAVLGTSRWAPLSRLDAQPATLYADTVLGAARAVGRHMQIRISAPRVTTAGRPVDLLRTIARGSGIRVRDVQLERDWWRDDAGPFIGSMLDGGRAVALLPDSRSSYRCHDVAENTSWRVDAVTAATIAPRARMFYRSLDGDTVSVGRLVMFAAYRCRREVMMVILLGAAVSALGLLPAIATSIVFNDLVPNSNRTHVIEMVAFLIAVAASVGLFSMSNWLVILRLEGKMGAALMAGVWDRLLSMPMTFFRSYTAGNLATRAMAIEAIRQTLSSTTIIALLYGMVAVTQFGFLLHLNMQLALWCAAMMSVAVTVTLVCAYVQIRSQRVVVALQAQQAGTVLQLLGNIAKLRTAGAEGRAFALWARQFAEQRQKQYNVRVIGNLQRAFFQAFPILMNMVLFALAVPMLGADGAMRTGDFIAFLTASVAVTQGMLTVSTMLVNVVNVLPLYEQIKPILLTAPETTLGAADPGQLRGHVAVQQLVFRYQADGPLALRSVSFEAQPGEFVALVGPSGSGKSTTLRLLLGFERAENGVVQFDGQDLAGLDVRAVRSQMGVVLQAAQLQPGSILTNILGPHMLTIDDALEAAQMAGLDEDIRGMAMGIHTVIGQGTSTLSGGQRQRLMIARALVGRPKILLFDEATSALDNHTQAVVSASLNRLRVTRIVIAHRLSTIRQADRIYVMQAGAVVQAGTYDELMSQRGPFEELARRQLA